MAKLIANVHAAGAWWGPAHGRVDPPADVAALITNPSCWSDTPNLDQAPAVEAPHLDPPAPALDVPDDELDQLDKPTLLAVAEDAGIDVDGRWGKARIIDAIRSQ